MPGKVVRQATKLLEAMCPFPSESMAKNAPCSWQFAGASRAGDKSAPKLRLCALAHHAVPCSQRSAGPLWRYLRQIPQHPNAAAR